MKPKRHYIVGTSGYSFADWVGTFYPPKTRSGDMLAEYVRHFETAEINFTFYRVPTARTIAAIAGKTQPGFRLWIKANQQTTHRGDRSVAEAFLDGIAPAVEAGKLAGVLLQFPQSFHRTVANRWYLGDVLADMSAVPLAVEFRHGSWAHPSVFEGLRARGATLVVPDVPEVPGLFSIPASATTATGYLRLHSRDAAKWHGPAGTDRYDYSYDERELTQLVRQWEELDEPMDEVYVFFNNCHHGQAARNAEAMRRILEQI